MIAKLATKKISDKEIDKLMEIINEMEHCVKEDDRLAYNDLDVQFHDFILNISGNGRLKEIYNNTGYVQLKISGRMNLSFKEHKNIALAIKERNCDEANKLSQIHIENILKSILKDEKRG